MLYRTSIIGTYQYHIFFDILTSLIGTHSCSLSNTPLWAKIVHLKNGVPQTDPTNGKLFRSQWSPTNVMSVDSVEHNINELRQMDIYVSVWGTKVSVWRRKVKIFPIYRIRVPHVSVCGRLFSIEGKQFSINRNHFRTR